MIKRDHFLRFKTLLLVFAFLFSALLALPVIHGFGIASSNGNEMGGAPLSASNIQSMSQTLTNPGYVNTSLNMLSNTLSTGNSVSNSYNPNAMAYDSASNELYVVDSSSGYITLINGQTNSIITSFYVAPYLSGIAYDSGNGYIYVGMPDSNQLAVISGTTVINYVSVGDYPVSLTYDSGNGNIYVAEEFGNNVTAVNLFTVVATISVGQDPLGITYDLGNGEVYVTNSYSNTVSAISGNSLVAIISVGSSPSGVVYDSVTNTVYVTNYFDGTVSLIGQSFPSTNDVFDTVTVGGSPTYIGVDSNNGNVFVANDNGNVSVITGTYFSGISVSEVITLGLNGQGIVYNPYNGYIYVSEFSLISVINGASYATLNPIVLNYIPAGEAFDPTNGYLYVADINMANVSVIDTSTGKIIQNIPVGLYPGFVSYDPQNSEVFVANSYSSTISVIYTPLNIVVDTISLNMPSNSMGGMTFDSVNNALYLTEQSGTDLIGVNAVTDGVTYYSVGASMGPITYDQSNNMLYASSAYGNDVEVITPITNSISTSIPIQSSPSGLAVDQTNGNLYIAEQFDSNVTVVNTTTNQIVDVIGTNYGPNSVMYDQNNGYLYITNPYFNEMTVINGQTNAVVGTISVGSFPFQAILDSANKMIYVTDALSGTISMIVQKAVTVYQVTFTETGLNQGTQWNITLNGQEINSSASTIVFDEPNGTYSYSTNPVVGYYLSSGGSGTIMVNGASTTRGVSYDRFATVYLTADPQNANVSENGYNITLTKGIATLSLEAGTYYFNASLAGYTSYSNLIDVKAGGTYNLFIKLTSLSNAGFLSGTVTPRDALVTANGITVPTYNGFFNESLSPGRYYITITAKGYTGQTFVENIDKGQTTSLTVSLSHSSTTVTLSGYLDPVDASLTLNGFSAYVNQNGYYQISVPSGIYTVSAYAGGYYPFSNTMDLTGNTFLNISMNSLPSATSQTSGSGVNIQGYGAKVASISTNGDTISFNYTSTSNGKILVEVPFSDLKDTSIADLVKSKVYIDGVSYTNFTITVSSNYTIILEVYNLKPGDPTVYWAYSPNSVIPSYYALTFSETGLPSGTKWNLTVDNQTYSSTTSSITVHLENGTYKYGLDQITNYTVSISGGNVTINGKTDNISVSYTALSKATPLGLSEYEVIGIVVVAVVVIGAVVAIALRRKH